MKPMQSTYPTSLEKFPNYLPAENVDTNKTKLLLNRLGSDSYPTRMNISIEMITDAAMPLSSDARALLADRLTESLDPLNDIDVRAAWAGEALKRLSEVRSGKVKSIPAEDVLVRIRSLIIRPN